MTLKKINANKSFGGETAFYVHTSRVCQCDMTFSIYLPPQSNEENKLPVLYWLSGLTCDENNFMQKSGVQRMAAELGIIIVAPDTSPRGEEVADDPDASYDMGLGAGFYVNASQMPWRKHYQMYDYVTQELPELISQHFPVTDRRAISGHSMGGHGALVCALRDPQLYSSVSAFSPICHPSSVAWGEKAFSHYLGDNVEDWHAYDASELIKKVDKHLPMRIDVGANDDYLQDQLTPGVLLEAAKEKNYEIDYHLHPGYDHSYYFIASFITEHLQFHAKHLLD
jgi:S-formylglutathione hydrolase